jgi:protein tyrosine phosphatase (PTP) superfamily phosphohydrolase (DUF442 family)
MPQVLRIGILWVALCVAQWVASAGPATARQVPGIENCFEVTPRLFSGGQPEGNAGFASLKTLGVRTLISVDGAPPDVERAARFGLRYVHIPHGYDGIASNVAVRLEKALRTSDGPAFVHCHHGQHRGPAAVGILCQATEGWSHEKALDWLRQAGTAADYAGLFRSNVRFQPATAAALAALPDTFPSRVKPPPLIDAMLEIDRLWDRLKSARQSAWTTAGERDQSRPAEDAALFAEAFRELARHADTATQPEPFRQNVRDSGALGDGLRRVLGDTTLSSDERAQRVGALLDAIGTNCRDCHARYRN